MLTALYSLSCPSFLAYHVICAKKSFFSKKTNKEKKKRFSEKKTSSRLDTILVNLRLSAYEKYPLVVPKKNKPIDNQIIEYLEESDLIFVTAGKQNQYSGIARTIRPTDKLISQFEKNKIEAILIDSSPVELRNTKKEEITKIQRQKERPLFKAKIPLKKYNEFWEENNLTLNGSRRMPFCRRIFSNNSFDLGGRYYGSYQQLSKSDRKKLLINGNPVVEPDYSGLHINLIYTFAGLQLEGKAYDVPGYDEAVIKAVMLRLLNGSKVNNQSNKQLIGQINKSAGVVVPDISLEYKKKLASYNAYLCPKPKKPACLEGFIEEIPAGTNGQDLLNAIKDRHSKVKDLLGSKDIGLRLQNKDSIIMSDVLNRLIDLKIPALPVHDSVIVQENHKQMTIDVMKEAYNSNTGFNINVK